MLAALQVGIRKVVHGVQLLIASPIHVRARGVFSGSLLRRQIRLGRFLAHAGANENVRRHMQGMGDRRRDGGIAARRVEALIGQAGIIVIVDEVVRYAGVLRLLGEDFLQNRAADPLVSEALVIRVGGGDQRERIEDAGFAIPRMLLIDLLHGLRVGLGSGLWRALLVVRVVSGDGGDVVAFASAGFLP